MNNKSYHSRRGFFFEQKRSNLKQIMWKCIRSQLTVNYIMHVQVQTNKTNNRMYKYSAQTLIYCSTIVIFNIMIVGGKLGTRSCLFLGAISNTTKSYKANEKVLDAQTLLIFKHERIPLVTIHYLAQLLPANPPPATYATLIF